MSEARIRLLTWDKGWEGWRRNIVGGVLLGWLVFGTSSGLLLVLDGWDKDPSGSMSLNRCEEVGDSFPKHYITIA
jgi:hypothetical protein